MGCNNHILVGGENRRSILLAMMTFLVWACHPTYSFLSKRTYTSFVIRHVESGTRSMSIITDLLPASLQQQCHHHRNPSPSLPPPIYRRTITTLKASNNNNNNNNNPKKNLWSVEECLTAYHHHNQEEKDDDDDNNNDSKRIHFIDSSWYHKGNRNGRDEFEAGPRIPGAHYLDTLDISTTKELFPELNPKGLWAMLPPKELFAATMDAMGIRNEDQVIIYGRKGSLFAPRTWFLFRTFGHERVGLMQGSLEDWVDSGGPVDTDSISYNLRARDLVGESSSKLNYQIPDQVKEQIVDMDAVMEIIKGQEQEPKMDSSSLPRSSPPTVIVDTRGSSFLKKGHMPGAIHIPYSSLVEPDNQLVLKPVSELETILKSKGLDTSSPLFPQVVLSCGSGVSVCHMALVLEECGCDPPPLVYDGSWNEWGKDPNTPKVHVAPTVDS